MANLIQHKRSSTSGVIPAATGLSYGELAINYADENVYIKNIYNQVVDISPVKNVSAGPAISVINNSGDFVVSVSGDLSELTNVTARNVLFNVRNDNSSIKYAGQAIYAAGIHANKIIIPGLYVADDSIPEIQFMGLVREDIPINTEGQVVHFGTIENVATDGSASNIGVGDETWVAGDILYAHPTEAGKLTKYPSKHSLVIALVLYAHANQGVLQVRPTTFPHINELHDVNTSGVTNNQYLRYDSATDYWLPTSSGIFDNVYVSGSVGIGINPPEYKLQVNGSFGATTKSFRINHPSRPNYTLEYGSLESPYHGVRLTGRGRVVKGVGVVDLPPYLKDLVHDDNNINIQLTNLKHNKTLYVSDIDLNNNQFTVRANRAKTVGDLEFFWTFSGVRKDVENLVVEKPKEV